MWRPRTYGDGTAEAIDHVVKDLIETAFRSASDILKRNRAILDASANELLARETLNHDDLTKMTAGLDHGAAPEKTLVAAE